MSKNREDIATYLANIGEPDLAGLMRDPWGRWPGGSAAAAIVARLGFRSMAGYPEAGEMAAEVKRRAEGGS